MLAGFDNKRVEFLLLNRKLNCSSDYTYVMDYILEKDKLVCLGQIKLSVGLPRKVVYGHFIKSVVKELHS